MRRHSSREREGFRPFTGGEREDMNLPEAALFKESKSLCECAFVLPGEADEQIGTDVDIIPEKSTNSLHYITILRRRIPSVHKREYPVASALKGNMEMRLESVSFCKRFKQAVVDSQRFDRTEAKTAKPLDQRYFSDKLRQRYLTVLAVQPQMHPGEHDLTAAGRNYGTNLLQYIVRRATDGKSSSIGNCTVGTEMIAAVLHLDEGAGMKQRLREEKRIPLRTVKDILTAYRKTPGIIPEELCKKKRNMLFFPVADEQMNPERLRLFLRKMLRPAPARDDNRAGGRSAYPPDHLPAFFIRNRSDGTAHQNRRIAVGGVAQNCFRLGEGIGKSLALVLVGPASKRADPDSLTGEMVQHRVLPLPPTSRQVRVRR